MTKYSWLNLWLLLYYFRYFWPELVNGLLMPLPWTEPLGVMLFYYVWKVDTLVLLFFSHQDGLYQPSASTFSINTDSWRTFILILFKSGSFSVSIIF